MNDGYAIKAEETGYFIEHFSMNSCTLDVSTIETTGPFRSMELAESAQKQMRLAAQ